jgi:hypothetical protein
MSDSDFIDNIICFFCRKPIQPQKKTHTLNDCIFNTFCGDSDDDIYDDYSLIPDDDDDSPIVWSSWNPDPAIPPPPWKKPPTKSFPGWEHIKKNKKGKGKNNNNEGGKS